MQAVHSARTESLLLSLVALVAEQLSCDFQHRAALTTMIPIIVHCSFATLSRGNIHHMLRVFVCSFVCCLSIDTAAHLSCASCFYSANQKKKKYPEEEENIIISSTKHKKYNFVVCC